MSKGEQPHPKALTGMNPAKVLILTSFSVAEGYVTTQSFIDLI